MNSYDLSHDWFDWCFENPEKITATHTALYFFAIEHCNRLGWKTNFGMPTQMAMDAIGCKNWRTYSKAFNDIVEWGFFKLIEKSKNQWSATVIAIVKNTKANTKALTKATQKQVQKQSNCSDNSTVVIDKLETKKLETNNTVEIEFENFRKIYPGTKRGFETEFKNFQKHKDYKEVVFLLIPALEKLKHWRDLKKLSGGFVPEYANLQTWINQRRWEVELEEIKQNGDKTLKGNINREVSESRKHEEDRL